MATPVGPLVAACVFSTGVYKAMKFKQPVYFRFSTVVAFGALIGSLCTPPASNLQDLIIREGVNIALGGIISSVASFALESLAFHSS